MRYRSLEEQRVADKALSDAVCFKGKIDEAKEAKIRQALANGGNPYCSIRLESGNEMPLDEYINNLPSGRKKKVLRAVLYGRKPSAPLEGTWEEIQAQRKICTHTCLHCKCAEQDKNRSREG